MNFHDSNTIRELLRERQLKSFTLGTPAKILRITYKEPRGILSNCYLKLELLTQRRKRNKYIFASAKKVLSFYSYCM